MQLQIQRKTHNALRIDNLTRGQSLVTRGKAAANFFTRLRGLIGRPPLEDGEGLLILPCNSIHTHFMGFTIDVLYVSRDHQIVAIDEAMKPWRFGRIHSRARFVVELPTGTVANTGARIGDQLYVKGLPALGIRNSPLVL